MIQSEYLAVISMIQSQFTFVDSMIQSQYPAVNSMICSQFQLKKMAWPNHSLQLALFTIYSCKITTAVAVSFCCSWLFQPSRVVCSCCVLYTGYRLDTVFLTCSNTSVDGFKCVCQNVVWSDHILECGVKWSYPGMWCEVTIPLEHAGTAKQVCGR